MRWIGYVATILWWSGIARSLSTLNRGHSYKISPKPCKVPGSESKEGYKISPKPCKVPGSESKEGYKISPKPCKVPGSESKEGYKISPKPCKVPGSESKEGYKISPKPCKVPGSESKEGYKISPKPCKVPGSESKEGYKISPKPCKVPGSESKEGTCMFVWECIKSEGTHVGVCVDTFMFGSCCIHNTTINTISTSHHPHQQQQHSDTITSTLKPSLFNPAASTGTTKPTTSISPSSWSTGSNTPRPGLHQFSGSHGSTRPLKPYSHSAARPLQKRPHAKPTSEHDVDRLQTPAVSVSASTPSTWTKDRPQKTKRPGNHHENHSHHQKTRPDEEQTSEKPLSVQSQPGFKDKIETHNTLIVRLPGKEHADDEAAGSAKPNKPNNQRPVESRPDEKTGDVDLNVQETINRPSSVNSVVENETAKEPHPNVNFIHTERPHWTTKPVQSKPSSTDFPKPFFSIKTTTYRPISISSQANQRPNFISKPNTWSTKTSTTMTTRPTFKQPSISAAGSIPQTSHWQVTTEPVFVTKQKPSSLSSSSSSSFSSTSSFSSSSFPSSLSSSSSSSKPMTITETIRIPSSGTNSHFWSNSWTPPRPSLKPHWTDSPSLLQNGPENFPSRPSFKPTESQQSTEYQKPLGSAHYITTSHLETSTRPRPTKKTTILSTTSLSTSIPSTTIRATTNPTTAITTVTTAPSSTVSASTTSIVPTQGSADREGSTAASEKGTGSVMTIPAADESKHMQCGVPPLFPRPETRIVGGKDAPFGRWPWQVSVRRTSFFGFSSTHRCGGAVLNENWIATAGHCVDDLLTTQIRIRVGEYDFSSVQERLPYVERGVAKKVVHPKYNFFTYEYDLALVRLESSLTFAAHISPICLPATDDLLIGENATVTGWGRLSEGGTLPSILQEVSVPIVSNDRCKSMFLRAGRHEVIPDIFLCAGYETGGQDSCQGDSGGPLQVRGKDGRYFLAGIISWGIGCAEANLPGVCTRISKFVPWILKNVT